MNAQSTAPMSTPSSSLDGLASVRLNRSSDTPTIVQFPPQKFMTTGATPELLIELAYDVLGFQLAGEPSWIKSEKYDVDASIEDLSDDTRTPPEERERKRRLVIQSLLAEHFKLKVTRETKNLPLYALVIAQNNPKLASMTLKPSGSANLNSEKQQPAPMMNVRRGELTMTDAPISKLAHELSRQLGCRVLDKTGLKGNYDLTLNWQPEDQRQMSNRTEDKNHSRASIFSAIQEQLGLKLEPQTGPVEIVTIVHIEKPSEN
jgi:uncharacterized protein (TIGR03435 family)